MQEAECIKKLLAAAAAVEAPPALAQTLHSLAWYLRPVLQECDAEWERGWVSFALWIEKLEPVMRSHRLQQWLRVLSEDVSVNDARHVLAKLLAEQCAAVAPCI